MLKVTPAVIWFVVWIFTSAKAFMFSAPFIGLFVCLSIIRIIVKLLARFS